MMQFPLPDGALLAVIEPGDIERLKDGKPLEVGNVCICFTPDMQRFAETIGITRELAQKGERWQQRIHLTAEQLDAALKAYQKLPEVKR